MKWTDTIAGNISTELILSNVSWNWDLNLVSPCMFLLLNPSPSSASWVLKIIVNMLFGKCENLKPHLASSHFPWSKEIEYFTKERFINSIFHKNKWTVSKKNTIYSHPKWQSLKDDNGSKVTDNCWGLLMH